MQDTAGVPITTTPEIGFYSARTIRPKVRGILALAP
jgi:hypothetical protein